MNEILKLQVKNKFLVFILFSIGVFSQNTPIEITIYSVTSFDSIPSERIFTINYHIQNLADKDISLFLNPNQLTANLRGSNSKNIIYKIFQAEEQLDFEYLFGDKIYRQFSSNLDNAKTLEEKNKITSEFIKNGLKMDLDSIFKKMKKDGNYDPLDKISSAKIALLILKAKEKISFHLKQTWDKNRYFKVEDNEYYLDEKKPHFIQLSISSIKSLNKEVLASEEIQNLIKNTTFVNGIFTSNKMEINFKE